MASYPLLSVTQVCFLSLALSLQIVDFLLSLFQRACIGLNQATGPSLGNPVESQSLSMGIGLLASLLSGPQVLTNRTLAIVSHGIEYCYEMKLNVSSLII